jgi:hypothetical protein
MSKEKGPAFRLTNSNLSQRVDTLGCSPSHLYSNPFPIFFSIRRLSIGLEQSIHETQEVLESAVVYQTVWQSASCDCQLGSQTSTKRPMPCREKRANWKKY